VQGGVRQRTHDPHRRCTVGVRKQCTGVGKQAETPEPCMQGCTDLYSVVNGRSFNYDEHYRGTPP
jgi:hypothetical protein